MKQIELHINVRKVLDDELPVVRDLHARAFRDHYSVYRFHGETLAYQQERFNQGVRLVALINGEIVGTIQYRLDAKHIHLLGLAVDHGHRRNGVARALIQHVASLAPALGHDTLAVDTVVETGNVRIFERCGFSETSKRTLPECESDMYSVLHCVQMERNVDGAGTPRVDAT